MSGSAGDSLIPSSLSPGSNIEAGNTVVTKPQVANFEENNILLGDPIPTPSTAVPFSQRRSSEVELRSAEGVHPGADIFFVETGKLADPKMSSIEKAVSSVDILSLGGDNIIASNGSDKGSSKSSRPHPPRPLETLPTESALALSPKRSDGGKENMKRDGNVTFQDILRTMHPSPLLPAPGRYNGYSQQISSISCSTNWEFDSVIFDWKISNFLTLRSIAKERGLPPDGDTLASPVHRDAAQGEWWLRLYPYQRHKDYSGQVSLFIYTSRTQKETVFFAMLFTAIDNDGNEVQDSISGCGLHSFGKSDAIRNYGYYDFLPDNNAIEKSLHKDGTLHIRSEIRIFKRQCTVVDGRIEASNK